MEQIERIQYYEEILNEIDTAIKEIERAIEKFHHLPKQVEELESYYSSSAWMKDYEADEQGKLPEKLKRGVLSEDAIYNVLEKYRWLSEMINCDSDKE
ncbi:MAG: DUF4298 domain-containing protein [Lachnospiraceae bacterium]|nr:DUF4298 domain-containing protein [Lachnospiraceae bacterium]